MVSLIITETGKSNKPVAILGIKDTSRTYLEWMERIAKNPKSFSFEIILKGDCDELLSEKYFKGFKQVLGLMTNLTENLDASVDAGILGSILGFLESITFVQDTKEELEGTEGKCEL